jgi:hypothetical protein
MCVKQNTTLVVTAAAAVQDPFEGGGGGRGGERERERERERGEREGGGTVHGQVETTAVGRAGSRNSGAGGTQ